MRTSLVILTTPRSGSSWLSSLCRSTGRLGQPREWLTSLVRPASPHRIDLPPTGPDRADAFRAALALAAGTPNGAVGVKIITSVWEELPAALHAWGIGDGRSDTWLARLFPRAAVLVLRRRDRVGQAISWWRAVQTGRFARFAHEAEGETMPPYDAAQLRAALADIVRFERILDAAAESFRSHADATTMEVVYEDALLDPEGVVRRFADLAEIPLDPSLALSTELAVQRDGATEAIRARFEAEVAAAPAEVVR